MLAVRAWLRYVVPLTLIAALVFAPLVYVAWRVGAPMDLVQARMRLRLAWTLAGVAWIFQWLLVAAAAPAVRSVVAGAPLSQWRAFTAGLRSVIRALAPWLVVITAIGLGGLALVVPGLLLLVLLSLTGASTHLGSPPALALADSVELVRRDFRRVALLVGAIIVVDLAICLALQQTLLPVLAKKLPPSKLLPIRTFVRTVPLALAALAPLVACALAATYERLTARRTS